MKKVVILLCLFVCSLSQSLFAQADCLAGIDFGFNTSSSSSNYQSVEDNSSGLYNSNLFYGLYFTKHLVGGIGFQYYRSVSKQPSSIYTYEKFRSISLSPFLRYYTNANVFGHVQFNCGKSYGDSKLNKTYIHPSITNLENHADMFVYGFSVGIGYAIKAGDYILIEPLLKYNFQKTNYENSDFVSTQNGLSFNIGISFNANL